MNEVISDNTATFLPISLSSLVSFSFPLPSDSPRILFPCDLVCPDLVAEVVLQLVRPVSLEHLIDSWYHIDEAKFYGWHQVAAVDSGLGCLLGICVGTDLSAGELVVAFS